MEDQDERKPIMSRESWDALCDQVADRMKVFTKPYVTPLIYDGPGEPPRFGSGTYVDLSSIDRSPMTLVTCEHVIRHQPQSHRPDGAAKPIPLVGVVRSDRHPKDAATVAMNLAAWESDPHNGAFLPFSKFAPKHAPVEHEVFFFRGLAGENAYLGQGSAFDADVTGYATQARPGTGDDQTFELEWVPTKTQITSGTDPEKARSVRFDNAHGYSGSLVWNTRFVEGGSNLAAWTPDEAVVTGLLRRWVTGNTTLVAWRGEHLVDWLRSPSWA